jgi:PTS system mannose-specific IIC component
MVSRPIALGTIVGLALGDVTAGLYVAVPLELLWLGAVNLGAALPVHEALGTAAIAGATVLGEQALERAGLSGPALLPAAAATAVIVCAPLALLGRRADRMTERWNERLFARAERSLAAGDVDAAARVNLYGLALPFAVGFVLAPLGTAVVVLVVPTALARVPGALPVLALGWVAFAAFACASGAKAMRAVRASTYYFGALGVGLCLVLAAALAGGRS